MRYQALTLIVLGLAASACQVGPKLETFNPAHGPEGVRLTLELHDNEISGGKLEGELLEVRKDGLLLNVAPAPGAESRDPSAWLVPYAQIERTMMAQRSGWIYELDAGEREKLTLLSRFPQGLSPELLAALLATQNQEETIIAGQ